MTGLKEVLSAFDNIANELSSIPEGLQEEVTVKDSQFMNQDNTINVDRLSQTPEEAKNEARYISVRTQQPFNESGSTPEELEKVEEEIIDRYIRDYIETIFK